MHSTSFPSSARVAVPLSDDEKEVSLVFSNMAVKPIQSEVTLVCACNRVQLLLPPHSLQKVTPPAPPAPPSTVHPKVMLSQGHLGGGAVNCPATSSIEAKFIIKLMHPVGRLYRSTC